MSLILEVLFYVRILFFSLQITTVRQEWNFWGKNFGRNFLCAI